MLANAAWQALIGKYVLTPGFDKMGLRVTEPERMSMVSGQHPSQAFYNAFADPRTGEYNVAAVHQFLSEAEANAQAQQAWAQLNEQARMEREVAKFLGLIKGGVYVNSLEVANGVNSANNTYAGKWAGKKYSAVPDSLIQLKSSDIKAYYNSHKNMFKQTPSRALSYVVFEVSPTDDDMLALEKSVAEVGAQFAATEELKSFVRANRNGKIADNYVSAKQLSEEEAKALLDGATYGPVLKNNEWTMARALDTKIVPDSMGIRHIVLPYTQEALADSLLTVLKGGADFAQVAAQYSVYDATAANGGEVGRHAVLGLFGRIRCSACQCENRRYREDRFRRRHSADAGLPCRQTVEARSGRFDHLPGRGFGRYPPRHPQSGRHLLGERQRFGRSVQRRRFGCRRYAAHRVAGAGRAYDPRS